MMASSPSASTTHGPLDDDNAETSTSSASASTSTVVTVTTTPAETAASAALRTLIPNPWPRYGPVMEYKGIKVRRDPLKSSSIGFLCLLCKKTDKTEEDCTIKTQLTSKSNLKRHLNSQHKEDPTWIALMKEESEVRASAAAGGVATKRQGTITEMLSPASESNPSKRRKLAAHVTQPEVDEAIETYIVKGMQPFHTVSTPEFREMVRKLQPDRSVMSRRTLMRRVTKMYDRQKAGLVRKLEAVESVATTTDLWTAHHR